MRHFVGITLAVTLLAHGVSVAAANPLSSAGARSEDSVKALALQWFSQMQAGHIDRAQLAAKYSAQLTSDAVRAMSHQLQQYGASPIGDQVLRTRTIDDQTFYEVKLLFPRGESAAMLIGFDAEGKITGIDVLAMAGD